MAVTRLGIGDMQQSHNIQRVKLDGELAWYISIPSDLECTVFMDLLKLELLGLAQLMRKENRSSV